MHEVARGLSGSRMRQSLRDINFTPFFSDERRLVCPRPRCTATPTDPIGYLSCMRIKLEIEHVRGEVDDHLLTIAMSCHSLRRSGTQDTDDVRLLPALGTNAISSASTVAWCGAASACKRDQRDDRAGQERMLMMTAACNPESRDC